MFIFIVSTASAGFRAEGTAKPSPMLGSRVVRPHATTRMQGLSVAAETAQALHRM